MEKLELKILRKNDRGMVDVKPGAKIAETINEAIALSIEERSRLIKFEFNRVWIWVRGADSDPKAILRDYRRAVRGYIDKNVGPYPKMVLSAEEKGNDAHNRKSKKRKRPYVRI